MMPEPNVSTTAFAKLDVRGLLVMIPNTKPAHPQKNAPAKLPTTAPLIFENISTHSEFSFPEGVTQMSAANALAGAFIGALGGGSLALIFSSGTCNYKQPEVGNLAGDIMAKGIEAGLRFSWVVFCTIYGASAGMVVGACV